MSILHKLDMLRRRRFQELTGAIRDLAAIDGIVILPWHDPALPNFFALTEKNQDAVLENLSSLVHVCSQLASKGESLWNARGLTSAFFKQVGLQLAPGVLENIQPSDLVAGYNRTQQMIYLSLNHFLLVSYSFEELYCRPWMELFRRHTMIEKVLIERCIRLVMGQSNSTISNEDIPPHTLTETESIDRRAAICKSRFYSALHCNGRPAGFISVNQGRPFVRELAENMQRKADFGA